MPTTGSKTIVLDTDLFIANAQPWSLEALNKDAGTTFIVPPIVLWELDQLMQREQTRDKARSAVNVLRQQVGRGAATGPVSCVEGLTMRLALANEAADHALLESVPGTDGYGDDRLLACALALAADGDAVTVATSDFAVYAKAITLGLEGLHLEELVGGATTVLTGRQRRHFLSKWRRVEAADSAWALFLRIQDFLGIEFVHRALDSLRAADATDYRADGLRRLEALFSKWTKTTELWDVIEETLGLTAPRIPAMSVRLVSVPGRPATDGPPYPTWEQQRASTRPEEPGERTLRMEQEALAHKRREEYIIHNGLAIAERLKEYVIQQLGDEVLDRDG